MTHKSYLGRIHVNMNAMAALCFQLYADNQQSPIIISGGQKPKTALDPYFLHLKIQNLFLLML